MSSQYSYKHFDCKTSEEQSASQKKNAYGKAASLKNSLSCYASAEETGKRTSPNEEPNNCNLNK